MKTESPSLLFTVSFYFLFVVGTLLTVLAFTLVMVVQAPFIPHRTAMRRFRNLMKTYGHIVLFFARPFVKFEYEDCSGTPHEPCIYICNHRSASDPYMTGFLPGEIVHVVNKWPFRLPVLGIIARLAGYLSIREMPPAEFFEKGAALLAQGVSLVVFPEGTRSASRAMGQFHGAAFRLALQSGVPVVPVCLTGTENIPRKGSPMLSPGHIRIRMLPPVRPQEFQDQGPFKLKNHVRSVIAEECDRMEGIA